jgi:hypothetical protein
VAGGSQAFIATLLFDPSMSALSVLLVRCGAFVHISELRLYLRGLLFSTKGCGLQTREAPCTLTNSPIYKGIATMGMGNANIWERQDSSPKHYQGTSKGNTKGQH